MDTLDTAADMIQVALMDEVKNKGNFPFPGDAATGEPALHSFPPDCSEVIPMSLTNHNFIHSKCLNPSVSHTIKVPCS